MKVLNRDLIQKSEENAVNSGNFSFLTLMEKAGTAAAEEISKQFDVKNKKIAVVCGNGNNGGDGFVIADKLLQKGANINVFIPFSLPKTESAKYYFKKLPNNKIYTAFSGEYDIIIDAIFGIGINRPLEDSTVSLINEINQKRAVRISIDIPSGINCDNGIVYNTAIKADYTITFIAPKPCFFLPESVDYCGKVKVCDIGVLPVGFSFKTIETPTLPKRAKTSNKGTFGSALLICGSYGMAGAAILAGKACLRSGVGIAKMLFPRSIYKIITTAVPEAVCYPTLETFTGSLSSLLNLKKPLKKTNAVLFGCGVKNNRNTFKILKKLVKTCHKPLVIDADGINALSRCIDLLKKANAPIILTPHPAEMARLCNCDVQTIEKSRIETAVNFSKTYNCYLVLKGTNTLVASPDGQLFVNILGNSGMATGGSGDVLAGIIASLLAQGMPPLEAAKSAVYLHSFAADEVALQKGERALLPSDIIEAL